MWWNLISSRELSVFDNTGDDFRLGLYVVREEAVGIWDVSYRWNLVNNKQHCLMGVMERHLACCVSDRPGQVQLWAILCHKLS